MVENGPEGIDVGRRADGGEVSPGLFRGHVGRGAEDLSGVGQIPWVFHPFGETKVGHLRCAVGHEENVGRLEIAMDDPPGVAIVDRRADGLEEPRGGERFHWTGGELPEEAAPVDEGHREIMPPPHLADLEDRHDAGVVQLGGRLGLGMEPADVVLGGRVGPKHHLQGHDSAERHLPRLVDDPHSPGGDQREDFVITDLLMGCLGVPRSARARPVARRWGGGSRPQGIARQRHRVEVHFVRDAWGGWNPRPIGVMVCVGGLR